MLEIQNNTIKFTRGDTIRLCVNLRNADQTEYSMKTGDKIACNISGNDRNKIDPISLEFDTNDVIIPPEETVKLTPDKYHMEIKLITNQGDVYTVFGLRSVHDLNLIVYPYVKEREMSE